MQTYFSTCDDGVRVLNLSHAEGEEFCVASLEEAFAGAPCAGVLAFATGAEPLDQICGSLSRQNPSAVIAGCTSAGLISPGRGYSEGAGAVVVGFPSSAFRLHLLQAGEIESFLQLPTLPPPPQQTFPHRAAILLVDGLCMREEILCAKLAALLSLWQIPLVGGSAGDMLRFEQTWIHSQGRRLHNGFALLLLESAHPLACFHHQHFASTDLRTVVTDAQPLTRTVHTLDGEPAAAAYARRLGLRPADLTPAVFASNPLIIRYHDQSYVRAIQQVTPKGGLKFYCAIERGLVLRYARPLDMLPALQQQLASLQDRMGALQLVFAADCILRRLDLQQDGLLAEANRLLTSWPLAGFSSYGEQLEGVHMNYTLTGIAIGTGRAA